MSKANGSEYLIHVPRTESEESPFSLVQELYIKRVCAAMFAEACNQSTPFPLQQAQRYLERICPPMIAALVERERTIMVSDMKRALQEGTEAIILGRLEEVRQKVNDWLDKQMRSYCTSAEQNVDQQINRMEKWIERAERRMDDKAERFTWRYWWQRLLRNYGH